MPDAPRHPRVGAFEVRRPLGQGGMGCVFAGLHLQTGAPVALKVLAAEGAVRATLLRAFGNEVRAVAALNHPGIVPILDYGELSEPLGGAPAGDPYLVMPLAEGGTAWPLCGRLAWPALRGLLLSVLDALAHAHSRGVLHRDLKPSNLLLRAPREPEAGVWLADFGLAALERERYPEAAALTGGGTEGYRAPEQGDPTQGPEGPWTDLYALGKVALALRMQEGGRRELPPTGFWDWVVQLLDPDPGRRPRFAAEAADRLTALDVNASTRSTWWRNEVPQSSLEPAMSASVLALREPGLVGRRAERDALWSALLAACRGEVRAVSLEAPRGLGRSRLAAWLAEQAHERGLVEVVRVRFEPGAVTAEQLGRALRPLLGLADARVAAPERLWGLLSPEDWGEGALRRLAELVWPPRGRGARVDLAPAMNTLGLLRRALVELSLRRPIVLVLDDLHHAPDALGLVQALLRAQRGEAAVLVVLTASEDGLRLRPHLLSALAALEQSAGLTRLRLAPLDRDDHVLLVRELVGRGHAALGAVVERTLGDPGFAVQVSRELRGAAPGPALALPDALQDIYTDRLLRLMSTLGAQARTALWLQALLGLEPDVEEWRAACVAAGIPASTEGIERLLRAGLASGSAERPCFASALVTATLAQLAEHEGEAPALHAACAEALGEDQPERRALHLLAAGQPASALAPLTAALEDHARAHRLHRAAHLATLREALLGRVQVPEDDPVRLDGEIALAVMHIGHGEYARARDLARGAAERAERAGLTLRHHHALRMLALAEWRMGRLDLYLAHNRRLVAEATGRPLGRAQLDLAYGLRMEGHVDEALVQARRAREVFVEVGCTLGELDSQRFESILSAERGTLEEALVFTEALARDARALGAVETVAAAWVGRGEALRRLGRPAEAAEAHSQAAKLLEAVGSKDALVPQMNLGVIYVELGDLHRARAVLAALDRVLERSDVPLYRGYGVVFLLLTLARLGDWRAVQPGWSGVDLSLAKVYPDEVLPALEEAAALAEAAGAGAAAQVAWRLLERAAEQAGRPQLALEAQGRRRASGTDDAIPTAPPKGG